MKEEIIELAKSLRLQYPTWREGQSLFNAAYKLYPEFANSVRGTDTDCFYRSDKIKSFLDEIEKYEKCIECKS